MRQVVALVRAARKRRSLDWYSQLQLHASIHGRKITQTFEELFTEHAPPEKLDVSEKAVSLMEKLAAEEYAELKRQHGSI